MTPKPKNPPLRDRAWLNFVRDLPCIITGLRGSTYETVDPAHIGTLGKGIKSPDNEVLPLIHHKHLEAHQAGEISFFREHLSDADLRAALRALAREHYLAWKATQ